MGTDSSNTSTSRSTHWKGIFCLEGDWWNDLNASATVRPILELAGSGWKGGIPFHHRDVATREEPYFYLAKWSQRGFATYPILYLAFHGSAGAIHLSDARRARSEVTLDELADHLEGKCDKRVVHFGSCETVSGDQRHLNRFLTRTRALAVTGYRAEADWMKSAAFEVLLLDALQHNALTRGGMKAVKRRVELELGKLAKEVGFRMVVRPG